MNPDGKIHAQLIAEAARTVPAAELLRWADKISAQEAAASLGIDLTGVPVPLRRIIEECEGSRSVEFRRGIVLALRTAGLVNTHWQNQNTVALAWTGPDSGVIGIQRTEQVLLDLISMATRTLVVVSFAAHRVPRLLEEIQRSARRGINIKLILEFEESSDGQLSFDALAAFSGLDKRVEVYKWPLSKREFNSAGRPGKLHMKCVVADGSKAFVSSANLTEDALNRNMELGVLIGGVEAFDLQRHFEALIQQRVLERVAR